MCNSHNQTNSTGTVYLPKGGFSNPTKPKIGNLVLGGYDLVQPSGPNMPLGRTVVLYGSEAAKEAYTTYVHNVLLPDDMTKAPWLKHLTSASR